MKQQDPLKTAQDLCMHGIALSQQGQREESLAVYAQIIKSFGKRRIEPFLKVLATAMFNTGSCLAALNRNEESVLAYDALIAKFDNQTDSHFALYVVKALMNKAYRLNALSRNDEAIATYETVIARFGSSKDPETMPYIDSVKSFLTERQAVLDAREQTARA